MTITQQWPQIYIDILKYDEKYQDWILKIVNLNKYLYNVSMSWHIQKKCTDSLWEFKEIWNWFWVYIFFFFFFRIVQLTSINIEVKERCTFL